MAKLYKAAENIYGPSALESVVSGDVIKAASQAFKVPFELTPEQLSLLQRKVGFKVITGGVPPSGHVVDACLRLFVEQSLTKHLQVNDDSKTLFIGCSPKELGLFGKFSGSMFSFSFCESKDAGRTLKFLDETATRYLRTKKISSIPGGTSRSASEDLWRTALGIKYSGRYTPTGEERFYFDDLYPKVRANTVVFVDSMYNVHQSRISEIFSETGCGSVVATGGYPEEMFHGQLPPDAIYNYSEQNGCVTTFSLEDNSTGYSHLAVTAKWPMTRPAWFHRGHHFGCEIRASFGHHRLLVINRSTKPITIERSMAIPEEKHHVKVLDVFKYAKDVRAGLPNPTRDYVVVRLLEYETIEKAMMRLNPKSLSVANATVNVTRRMGGLSIGGIREDPWELKGKHVGLLATVAVLRALFFQKESSEVISLMSSFSVNDSIYGKLLGHLVRFASLPYAAFMKLFSSDVHVSDYLVLECDFESEQRCCSSDNAIPSFVPDTPSAVRTTNAGNTENGIGEEPYILGLESFTKELVTETQPSPVPAQAPLEMLAPDTPGRAPTSGAFGFSHWKFGGKNNILCECCKWLATTGIQGGPDSSRWQEWVCPNGDEAAPFPCHDYEFTEQDRNFLETSYNKHEESPAWEHYRNAKANLPSAGVSRGIRTFVLQAPAGTGKSHVVRQFALKEPRSAVACSTRQLADQQRAALNAMGLMHIHCDVYNNLLSLRNLDVLFLDEAMSQSKEIVVALIRRTSCKTVVFLGDSNQTAIQHGLEGSSLSCLTALRKKSNSDSFEEYSWWDERKSHAFLVNFRNPGNHVRSSLYASFNDYPLSSFRGNDGSYRRISYEEGLKLKGSHQFLWWSASHEDAALREAAIEAGARTAGKTIRSCQGCEWPRVVILFPPGASKDICKLRSVHGFINVAVTRHTEELVIAANPGDLACTGFEKITELSQASSVLMELFPAPYCGTVALVEAEKDLRPAREEQLKDCDSLLACRDILMEPSEDPAVSQEYHNLVGCSLGNVSRPLQVDKHNVFLPQRAGCAIPVTGRSRIFSMTAGFHFTNSLPSVIGCIQSRYVNIRNERNNTEFVERDFAQKVVRHFFQETGFPVCHPMADEDKDRLFREQIAHAVEKKWHEGADIDAKFNDARFTIKDMFKSVAKTVEKVKASQDKPPQGISAFPKEMNLAFGFWFRVLTAYILELEKSCNGRSSIITDNGLTVERYIDTLGAMIADVESDRWVITDGTMFDSMQNSATQQIERAYFEHFLGSDGEAEVFFDAFYAVRSDWNIKADGGVSGKPETQNASGHVATLLVNGVVSKIISTYITACDGFNVITYKGDDYARFGANPRVVEEHVRELANYMDLVLKVEISHGAQFCGLVANGKNFTVSLVHRLKKVLGNKYRDYAHFSEMKTAVGDFVQLVDSLVAKGSQVFAANQKLYELTRDQVELCYTGLSSFTKLSEAQFLEYTTEIVCGEALPNATGGYDYLCDPSEVSKCSAKVDKLSFAEASSDAGEASSSYYSTCPSASSDDLTLLFEQRSLARFERWSGNRL